MIIDPPGHSRLGAHYFQTWCPSVRPSQKQRYNGNVKTKYMRENNEYLLAVAWWVILNSPDLFLLSCESCWLCCFYLAALFLRMKRISKLWRISYAIRCNIIICPYDETFSIISVNVCIEILYNPYSKWVVELEIHKIDVIDDPLGQTNSPAIANIVLCCFVCLDLKSGDVRTYGQHVRKQWSPIRPWLWVGRGDQ